MQTPKTKNCPCCGATIAAPLINNQEQWNMVMSSSMSKNDRDKAVDKMSIQERIVCPRARGRVGSGA